MKMILIYKIINYLIFAAYLTVSMAFALGVNVNMDKLTEETERYNPVKQYPKLLDNPWEIVETAILFLQFSMVFQKKKVGLYPYILISLYPYIIISLYD